MTKKNILPKLEKAIKEKYGEDVIRDISSEWSQEKEKQYIEDQKQLLKNTSKKQYDEKVEKNGYLVSRKLFNKNNSRNCPICEEYSFYAQDDLYMLKYDCCYKCFIKHVEGREEKWEERKIKILGDKIDENNKE